MREIAAVLEFYQAIEEWRRWNSELYRTANDRLPSARLFRGQRYNPERSRYPLSGHMHCPENLSKAELWESVPEGREDDYTKYLTMFDRASAGLQFAKHLNRLAEEITDWILNQAQQSENREETSPEHAAEWQAFFQHFGRKHGYTLDRLHGCNSLATALNIAIDQLVEATCPTTVVFEVQRN